MRFPRNATIFRGQLDAAPFASVFFIVLIFITLNASFVFWPGVKVELDLPDASGLAGTGGPAVVVAVDRAGQLYFENQIIKEADLLAKLRTSAAKAKSHQAALTLVIQADKLVAYQTVVRLAELAREAGINDVLQATRPAVFAPPIKDAP